MAKRRSFHFTHDKKKGDWKLFEQGSKRAILRSFTTQNDNAGRCYSFAVSLNALKLLK